MLKFFQASQKNHGKFILIGNTPCLAILTYSEYVNSHSKTRNSFSPPPD